MYKTYRKESDFSDVKWDYTFYPEKGVHIYYKRIGEGFALNVFGVEKRGNPGDYLIKSLAGYDIISNKEFEENTGVIYGDD